MQAAHTTSQKKQTPNQDKETKEGLQGTALFITHRLQHADQS